MTDLEPLFRLLVQRLAAQVPPRVHQPIAINELMDAVLPYRVVRRELGVDTAEDYEALLLQLCAGEGGFVQSEATAQSAMAAELRSHCPISRCSGCTARPSVVLRTDPLRSALVQDPEARYAPPSLPEPAHEAELEDLEAVDEPRLRTPEPEPGERPIWGAAIIVPSSQLPIDPAIREALGATPEAADDGEAGSRVRCPFCGGSLPARLMINFCPHCGMGQDVGKCRACGADMDVGWRFCVACGEEARGFAS